jgi:uncharacterized membrane protein
MSNDDSLYRAPASSLDRTSSGSARSLDDAIAGNFSFEIGDVLSEAWSLVPGSKGVILGAIAISLGVNMAVQGVSMLAATDESGLMSLLFFIVSLAAGAIIYTINAGVFIYAIKRAAGDESASFDDVLSCFDQVLPIFGLTLFQGFLMLLGFLALVIPGIYLMVGYLFAVPLKAERGLGIWESLETSRRSVGNAWFKVAVMMLVVGLGVAFGGLLTLGIGFIWLIPFGVLVMGVVYREIFGYGGA